MKRAEVWRWLRGQWAVLLINNASPDRSVPIAYRIAVDSIRSEFFPTHAEALTYAIKAVGLDTRPAHKEPT